MHITIKNLSDFFSLEKLDFFKFSDQIADRGERLELLVDKAQDLSVNVSVNIFFLYILIVINSLNPGFYIKLVYSFYIYIYIYIYIYTHTHIYP